MSHVTFLAVRGNATAWELQPTSVDLLFVTVPFSMLASATTAMWVHLAEQGVFVDDPTWDAVLFERDEHVWLYETDLTVLSHRDRALLQTVEDRGSAKGTNHAASLKDTLE